MFNILLFKFYFRKDQGLAYKDALFLSPHKFVGGPDTPGMNYYFTTLKYLHI